MTLLLVANDGSLLRTVYLSLSESFSAKTLVVSSFLSASELASSFVEMIRSDSFNCVVYISGETRNTERMKLLNVFFPSFIACQCQSSGLPLLCLSSLAVFGIPHSTPVQESSDRNPCCIYGNTKNQFDLFLLNSLDNLCATVLMPGSIINPNSRHCLFLKWSKFIKSCPPLFFALRFITLPGFLPCIHIDDLASIITSEVTALLDRHSSSVEKSAVFKICSFDLPLALIFSSIVRRSSFIVLPPIPVSLVSSLTFFLPSSIKKKIVLAFSAVSFEASYPSLSKRCYGRLDSYLESFSK